MKSTLEGVSTRITSQCQINMILACVKTNFKYQLILLVLINKISFSNMLCSNMLCSNLLLTLFLGLSVCLLTKAVLYCFHMVHYLLVSMRMVL